MEKKYKEDISVLDLSGDREEKKKQPLVIITDYHTSLCIKPY